MSLVSSFSRMLGGLWFRRLDLQGPPLPEGPVLLLLNHPNGLLDPLVPSALLPRPPRFLAKATLWKILPLRPFLALFDPIPIHRVQDSPDGQARPEATAAAFKAAHDAFAAGQAVSLFPEGISHGDPDLAPLKTGAARIALSAPMAVSVVPAGLVYGHRAFFRHSALLRLGDPIPFEDLRGRGTEPEAVRELTARIRVALLPLTLHAEDGDRLALAQDLAWMLAEGPRSRADLEAQRQRVRALLPQLEALSPAALEALRLRVAEVRAWLRAKGLRPDQVGHPYPWEEVRAWLPKALARHLLAILLLPLCLLFWPSYALVRWLANRFTDELDQTGTYKLVGGLLVHPLWAAFLAWAGWRAAGPWGLGGLALAALAALACLPLGERLREDWQAIRGFLHRAAPEVPELVEAREQLLEAFPELRGGKQSRLQL